jgi:hypothetical protein
MKAYWGSGVIAQRILDLGTRWRWVVSFTPRPLYLQRKSPWYPLDRRLSGPQSQCGYGGEEKNSRPFPGLHPPLIQPVAQRYTTELWNFQETWALWITVLSNENLVRLTYAEQVGERDHEEGGGVGIV